MAWTGIAELPLHDGHVPRWLAELMKKLARSIVEVIVLEYGPSELVKRLSDPLWFQAFNNIIGMDWDSSGSTTVTLGILRHVLSDGDLGVIVLGGKGKRMLAIPMEAELELNKIDAKIDSNELVNISRLAAKVDTSLVQDGYQLYHHSIVVSENGDWSIIQQGMNTSLGMARRYHWYSRRLRSFTVEPHEGIAGVKRHALNLIDKNVEGVRRLIVDLSNEKPEKNMRLIASALRVLRGDKSIVEWIKPETSTGITVYDRQVKLLYYRPIKLTNRLVKALVKAYESKPRSMEELLLVRGVGPDTIRALTLVADLIYREEPSWKDPVSHPLDPFKYAFAFGGKDGVPYPIRRKTMIEAIEFLRKAIEEARIGEKEKLLALRRLKNLYAKINYEGR